MNSFVANYAKRRPAAPLLYGLFLEDINHSLDGGLNANLVQNGSFDFCHFNYGTPNIKLTYDHMRFWQALPESCFSISKSKPISKNKPFALKLDLNGIAILKNCGYEKGENGNFMLSFGENLDGSFFYTASQDSLLTCYLEYANGRKSERCCLTLKKTNKFCPCMFKLKAGKGAFRLVCEFEGKASLYLTHFKLIPTNYHKSHNAYRFGKFNPNLVRALDCGAKFLRFPGGCVVEGDVELEHLYEWEKTIGSTETRASKPSVWEYLQSSEIGFFEFFCLCEDLHLAPLPVHHVGLICQIRTEVFGHRGYIAYSPESKEFKEKVLDSVAHLIYFAKGDVSSMDKTERLWAQKRADMGHKKPFKLSMIALGNENWDDIYFRNFNACVNGLKNYAYHGKKVDLLDKFKIQILTSSGVDINPQDTNPSWKYINKHYTDLIVDEHVYNTPSWFIDNYHRYDQYDPNLSKVFVGEYACHTKANGKGILGGTNTFNSALAEAVFMCGMENNPDIVKMSCYAPLFCKVGQANWDPDLIYFDKNKPIFTPNYYVQSLFAKNYGNTSIKLDYEKKKQIVGDFSIKNNENAIKNIEIFEKNKKKTLKNENFKNFCTIKGLKDFEAIIEFEKIIGNFTLSLAEDKKAGFSLNLHYDAKNKKMLYEKIVDNYRMTLEDLGSAQLANKIKVTFNCDEIKIFDISKHETLIGKKRIWKTQEKVFSSLTFDGKKVYVKLVNVANEKQAINLSLDKMLNATSGEMTTLEQSKQETQVCKHTQKVKCANNQIDLLLDPRSINILCLNRK